MQVYTKTAVTEHRYNNL